MQIFKRMSSNCQKSAQNMIEFVFVIVILVFLTLGVFEVGLFWQEVNQVYALNEEINANVAVENYQTLPMNTTCPAATRAIRILELKDAIITSQNDPPSYTRDAAQEDGTEPFRLYKYISSNTVNTPDGPRPQVTLWVDCRNPYEDGIITQLQFYHKLVVMKASIPRFDSPQPIVIIPDNIFIASPKLNTIRHY